MNKKSARFSHVAILESIPEGELHLGRQLRDDLPHQIRAANLPLTVSYTQIAGASQLNERLEELAMWARDKAQSPILHIECHGADDQTGLVLADGSFASWRDLKPGLTAINVASRLNLFVVMSACSGAYLAHAIQPIDRAPLWGMIGPETPESAAGLRDTYRNFYQALLSRTSGDEALKAVISTQSRRAKYLFTTAEYFFKRTYRQYLQEQGSEAAYVARAKGMEIKGREIGLTLPPHVLYAELKLKEREFFERYKQTFFMTDLYAENGERFPLSFEDVDQRSESQ
jgi:hypothetical protein